MQTKKMPKRHFKGIIGKVRIEGVNKAKVMVDLEHLSTQLVRTVVES
jgi:microsomal dipeptidase-like Zn-dependent dipeptidase